jgi:hypothetical protein
MDYHISGLPFTLHILYINSLSLRVRLSDTTILLHSMAELASAFSMVEPASV